MIKNTGLLLFVSCALVMSLAFAANPTNRAKDAAGTLSASAQGIAIPTRAPANYWLVKSLSMRTVACLCGNRYPAGMGAGENSDFTFRIAENDNGEAVSVHALCIKKNKGWNKRVLGHITLSLSRNGRAEIGMPGDDRYNADAAVLREMLNTEDLGSNMYALGSQSTASGKGMVLRAP
ncbi:MAG: hypothetical protein AAFW66_16460, partial [Pseudomonadota bacterium]